MVLLLPSIIKAYIAVRYLSTATSTAIIRVARAHYRLVWAALTFITMLPTPISVPCMIQVVRVSGTIRKAEEEAIRRARECVLKARRETDQDQNQAGMFSVAKGGILSDPEPDHVDRPHEDGEEDVGTVVMRDVETDSSEDDGKV